MLKIYYLKNFQNYYERNKLTIIFSDDIIYNITQEMQEQHQQPLENTQVHIGQSKRQYIYLKKSEKIKGQFDLRFDKIKNSLVTQGIGASWTFLKYKWFSSGESKNQPKSKEDFQRLQKQLPIEKCILKSEYKSEIRYTWIGHSTALIQVGQDNLIIDPVFSNRCSPSQFVGPKRYRDPACKIKDFQKIDMVLVSHDHYDHLDQDALNQLHKLYNPRFIAGLGSKSVFPKKSHLAEMDWMDQVIIPIAHKQYKITFVPVCHWSRRGAFDFNTRLWGGFVIETPYKQKIFYSGDTAYTGVFKEIGDKFGPFDLAILPIGAYLPRNLLAAQHVDPQQAVLIHKDLKSKKSVGVHWGTFPLGFEAFYQPKYDLQDAKIKHGVDKEAFITVHHGQSFVIL